MVLKLDITSFENAIQSLQNALRDYHKDGGEYTRDACIKRFEYTYELSHKMLKRYLEMSAPNPVEVDTYSFQTLIRTGYEKGILKNSWDVWYTYRHNRNKTAHGYNEHNAKDIVAGLDDFVTEVLYLRDALHHGIKAC